MSDKHGAHTSHGPVEEWPREVIEEQLETLKTRKEEIQSRIEILEEVLEERE